MSPPRLTPPEPTSLACEVCGQPMQKTSRDVQRMRETLRVVVQWECPTGHFATVTTHEDLTEEEEE